MDSSLAYAELFAVCEDRGGPCAFLTSGATRKEEKRDADLALLQGVCAQLGIPAGTFQSAPRERSRPPPPVEPVGAVPKAQ
eukprot:14038243-Alexandrium_andersonii.AAC.1